MHRDFKYSEDFSGSVVASLLKCLFNFQRKYSQRFFTFILQLSVKWARRFIYLFFFSLIHPSSHSLSTDCLQNVVKGFWASNDPLLK